MHDAARLHRSGPPRRARPHKLLLRLVLHRGTDPGQA
jgi:hypothetical protein